MRLHPESNIPLLLTGHLNCNGRSLRPGDRAQEGDSDPLPPYEFPSGCDLREFSNKLFQWYKARELFSGSSERS